VAVVFRGWMSFERFLDVDELEHLNASWFMSHGETIYGTFFENHPPIVHALLQPIVRSTEDAVQIIQRARGLILILTLGCLATMAVLGRRFAGKAGAVLAPLLLLTATYFFNEALEVRPDVPACLFFILSLFLLTRDSKPRTLFWSGVVLALAGFSTPKVIYAGAGAFLAAILWNDRSTTPPEPRNTVIRKGSMALLGALSVCAIGAGVLASFGVLDGFIRDVVVTSARMSIDEVGAMRVMLLRDSLEQNPLLWSIGTVGAILAARARNRAVSILLASFLTGFGGLFLIRAPLWQYYLTFLPQLALLGAVGSVALIARARRTGLLSSWIAGLLLTTGVVVPPALTLVRYQPMGIEIDILREVLAVTKPGDRVFDCWTGLYLTRLPAYRYFFLNADVQRLLEPRRMEEDLLRMLNDPEVTAVILDDFVLELPISVQNKIRLDFANVQDFGILGLVWRGPARGPGPRERGSIESDTREPSVRERSASE
jgi:hypothetical protein